MGVFRESGVDVVGPLGHRRFEHRHKGAGICLDAGDLAIVAHFSFKGFVIDQLLAVIVIALAVLDEEIARLQVVFDSMHDRQFKIPAVESRSEEHTSELQSLMRISYAVFCLKKKNTHTVQYTQST